MKKASALFEFPEMCGGVTYLRDAIVGYCYGTTVVGYSRAGDLQKVYRIIAEVFKKYPWIQRSKQTRKQRPTDR